MVSLPDLDSIFHQPVRTRLAVLLADKSHSFSDLKSQLDLTDGNLDAHLRKLSAAGYLQSRMVTKGRPHTRYSLSPSGAKAFRTYVAALHRILKNVTD